MGRELNCEDLYDYWWDVLYCHRQAMRYCASCCKEQRSMHKVHNSNNIGHCCNKLFLFMEEDNCVSWSLEHLKLKCSPIDSGLFMV